MKIKEIINEEFSVLDMRGVGIQTNKKGLVKQGFFKRLIKKLSAGTILGVIGILIGGVAGPGGSTVGLLLGMSAGAAFTGGKYKNKKVIIRGKELLQYAQEQGIDKEVESLHNKYFIDSAVRSKIDVEELQDYFLDNLGAAKGFIGLRQATDQDAYNDLDDRTKNIIKGHLSSAANDLESIAKKHNLKPAVISEIHAKIYGITPMHAFMNAAFGEEISATLEMKEEASAGATSSGNKD